MEIVGKYRPAPLRKSFMICRWSIVWLYCFLIAAPPAWALAADPFPTTVEISGKTLKKNGEALCEWGIFGLDLYRVALWVEVPSSEPEVLLQPNPIRCLELPFVRALSQKQMRKAYRESIKANQPADEEELKASIENFLETVQAAAKGSKMRLTCLPGKGLEIQQGKKKSLIPGNREFLDLILKLYIGNKPPTPAVARGLLGQHPKTVAEKATGTAEAEEKLRKVPTPDAPRR